MNRPFTDRAGYTRHCWECRHACFKKQDGIIYGYCKKRQFDVEKYDSPNNPCSVAAGCDSHA